MMATVRMVCPRCHHDFVRVGDSLQCVSCGSAFPVVAGIPDLRITPDPWIGLEADREKGQAVDASAEPGLEAAVRAYWAMTPTTSAAEAARHIDHVLHAEERTREWVAALQPAPAQEEHWLDLGCGTADLACAVPDGVSVTSLDVAFRWLIIARRRLQEAGRRSELVCGNAEALPFPDGSFNRVVALGTLEHCRDLGQVLGEARRVLRPGGRLHVRSVNRYSLLPEPHVGLWGVGWLSRQWADRYVRWRGGTGYQHHWPHGAAELGRALSQAGFVDTEVSAARMLKAEHRRLPGVFAPLVPLYHGLRQLPIASRVCRTVAPLLDAQGVAP